MAVKRIETKRNRAGTKYCENRRRFIGYKVDTRIDGKRYRNQVFPTRKEAEDFINKLKLKEQAERLNLMDGDITEIFLAVREKRIGLNEFHAVLTEYFKRQILGKN